MATVEQQQQQQQVTATGRQGRGGSDCLWKALGAKRDGAYLTDTGLVTMDETNVSIDNYMWLAAAADKHDA